MQKTKFDSYSNGSIPKGCSLCVQGRKLVLFITGLCSCRCFFCPLSEQKKDKDVIYANEMPVYDLKEIIKEAKKCSAKGAGITGGDPLVKLERTIEAIKLLKKEFGDDFHIHIYLPLDLVTKEKLNKLHDAGLDEIRFHPSLDSKKHWEKLKLAKELDWDVGIEIPVIPGKEKETKELLDFASGCVDFVNLNELEISSTNAGEFEKRRFIARDSISYGVSGSEALAISLLRYLEKKKVKAHYCTTRLKDNVQLRKRIMLRAKNIKKPYDTLTKEGTLIRGAVYHENLVPSFSYQNVIASIGRKEKDKIISGLKSMRETMIREHKIPPEMIEIDETKLRILTSKEIIKKIAAKINHKAAIVEEYPTYDQFEVEIDFLN